MLRPFSARESAINQLEITIDDLSTTLLALERPVANDLRFITVAAKINSNLQRSGDLAVSIAERSESLIKYPQFSVHADIPRLANLASSMVQQSSAAFVKKDTDDAHWRNPLRLLNGPAVRYAMRTCQKKSAVLPK